MRMSALSKIAVLAGAVGFALSYASASLAAKMMKVPPGACAFERKVIASGAACSHHCDPKTMWCQQGWCLNGQWTPIVNCYEPFCSAKCG
jgi:hypothetical protein